MKLLMIKIDILAILKVSYVQLKHQCIIESTYILDMYMVTKNKYCDYYNNTAMTSVGLDEAKGECSNDPTCSRFYYHCNTKRYYKCLESQMFGLSRTGCGSIVYTKGNHHPEAHILIE